MTSMVLFPLLSQLSRLRNSTCELSITAGSQEYTSICPPRCTTALPHGSSRNFSMGVPENESEGLIMDSDSHKWSLWVGALPLSHTGTEFLNSSGVYERMTKLPDTYLSVKGLDHPLLLFKVASRKPTRNCWKIGNSGRDRGATCILATFLENNAGNYRSIKMSLCSYIHF